ncbi:hypothetical protein ERO13_A01G056850v2 [Gossypium hirsutum]|nr:hypothetical protein ERO13_A01G056850v2 [Gossypium hirsutum]
MCPNHGDDYTITELNPMEWKCNNVLQDSKRVPILDSKEFQGHNEFLVSGVQKEQRKDRADLHLAISIVLFSSLILENNEEMEAVMIIDILRRTKANVVVASDGDNLEILASSKVKLVTDMLLDEAAKLTYDLVVLPGGLGGAQAFAKSDKLVNLLKKQAESNQPYGAICTSPALVLEPHGLIKLYHLLLLLPLTLNFHYCACTCFYFLITSHKFGKKATAYPAMCDKLSDQSHIDNRVVVDGNLITSRGPGTSMEFALGIVEKFFGRPKALELAKGLLVVRK